MNPRECEAQDKQAKTVAQILGRGSCQSSEEEGHVQGETEAWEEGLMLLSVTRDSETVTQGPTQSGADRKTSLKAKENLSEETNNSYSPVDNLTYSVMWVQETQK